MLYLIGAILKWLKCARRKTSWAIERTSEYVGEGRRAKEEKKRQKDTKESSRRHRRRVAWRGTSDPGTQPCAAPLPHPTSSTTGHHAGTASRSILRLEHEMSRTWSNTFESNRGPARGEPSSPLWAALPVQSLCGSGRRGMCGIVIESVTEE